MTKILAVLAIVGKFIGWVIGAAFGGGSDAKAVKKAYKETERAEKETAEAREETIHIQTREEVRQNEEKDLDDFFGETRY